MKFTLDRNNLLTGWELTIEGQEDLVVNLLQGYAGGDHELALDLFENAEPLPGYGNRKRHSDVVRVTVPLAEAQSEQDAARALLELLTATPGFSHG